MLKYEDVVRVPIFGELLKKEIQKGAKDIANEELEMIRGQRKVMKQSIIDVLTARFGHVDGKTARIINSIDDLKALRVIFQKSLKVFSLIDFKTMLEAKKPVSRKKAA